MFEPADIGSSEITDGFLPKIYFIISCIICGEDYNSLSDDPDKCIKCVNKKEYLILPPKKDRIKDTKYSYKGSLRRWDGKKLREVCEHDDCLIQPSFGHESDGIRRFCKVHKKNDMVDVANKRCEHDGCSIHPSFGYELDGIIRFCTIHKKDDMVDVVSKRCEHIDCSTRPSFGYESEGIKRFCKSHKKDDMVNVVSEKCEHNGCYKRPIFGYESDGIVRFCIAHKKGDMVDVVTKRCEYDGCLKHPIFGYKSDSIKRFCNVHKKDDMVDVKHEKCEKCNIRRANQKYHPYCFACYIVLFPNKSIVRRYGMKEAYFNEHLFSSCPNVIYDKQVSGGISRRRPDWLINYPTHSIIVECDEDQHDSYDEEDEKERMEEIQDDIGKPVIFLRFNPDSYIKDGKTITGCFEFDQENKMSVNENAFNTRKEIIISKLTEYSSVPKVKLTIEYLFYNS